jgi:hypothetical protein
MTRDGNVWQAAPNRRCDLFYARSVTPLRFTALWPVEHGANH